MMAIDEASLKKAGILTLVHASIGLAGIGLVYGSNAVSAVVAAVNPLIPLASIFGLYLISDYFFKDDYAMAAGYWALAILALVVFPQALNYVDSINAALGIQLSVLILRVIILVNAFLSVFIAKKTKLI